MRRMVVIADLHCGARFGLVPPVWQSHYTEGFNAKVSRFQKEIWQWYSKEMSLIQPVDFLVVNGDAIDGRGEKSGGTELLTTDRNEQANMAIRCIEEVNAKSILIIQGSPYHTSGGGDDFEYSIADKLGATYANREIVGFEGATFDFRHKVGNSSVPYGRMTANRKEATVNTIWQSRGMMDRINFVIRSHVHAYGLSDDGQTTCITTPCLQGQSKFGSRECTMVNDLGFLSFDVENGEAKMTHHKFDMRKFRFETKVY